MSDKQNGQNGTKEPSWTFQCGTCASLFDEETELKAHMELCQKVEQSGTSEPKFIYDKNPNFHGDSS